MNVSILLGLPETHQDRRYFVQCLQHSALQLSGFLTSDFWQIYVSRISTSSPVIQLAVLALGAQHEVYMLSQGSDRHIQCSADQNAIAVYSLNKYQKAVKLLNARLQDASRSSQGLEEILLACLLFISIELLRGDALLASTHLEGGLGVLSTSLPMLLKGADRNRKADPSVSDLAKMFALMGMQTYSYITAQVSLPSLSDSSPLHVAAHVQDPTLDCFHDLSGAQDSLNFLDARISRFIKVKAIPLKQQPPKIVCSPTDEEAIQEEYNPIWKERQLNFRLLAFWNKRFEELLQRTASVPGLPFNAYICAYDLQEAVGAAVLWLTYFSISITLATCLEVLETAFDGHLTSFKAIVKYAQFILSVSCQGIPSLSGSDLSYLQAKVIQPLYFVALKCREYSTRMQAIELLRSISMEGAWGGEIEATIAGYVMHLEELQR